MLHNANQVLKVEEEFNQYDLLKMKVTEDWTTLQRGVFMRQGSSVGNAPCLNFFDNITELKDLEQKFPDCSQYFKDNRNKIER